MSMLSSPVIIGEEAMWKRKQPNFSLNSVIR